MGNKIISKRAYHPTSSATPSSSSASPSRCPTSAQLSTTPSHPLVVLSHRIRVTLAFRQLSVTSTPGLSVNEKAGESRMERRALR